MYLKKKAIVDLLNKFMIVNIKNYIEQFILFFYKLHYFKTFLSKVVLNLGKKKFIDTNYSDIAYFFFQYICSFNFLFSRIVIAMKWKQSVTYYK